MEEEGNPSTSTRGKRGRGQGWERSGLEKRKEGAKNVQNEKERRRQQKEEKKGKKKTVAHSWEKALTPAKPEGEKTVDLGRKREGQEWEKG